MTSLVAQLKQEHDALKAKVTEITLQGIMTPEGFFELQQLMGLLRTHIAHEDRDMYPLLEQVALHDDDLRALLARFRAEINEVTDESARFFAFYVTPERSLDYAHDVARIFSMLTNRINTEETLLYPRLAALKPMPPAYQA